MSVAVAKKPVITIGPTVEVTNEEMAAKVRATREQHGQLLQDYHKVWYESGHTWVFQHFLGVGLMKNPNDLWAYQDLLYQYRPKTIIETGTYQGGSALWFGFLMDMLQIEGGHVYSIDIEDRRKCSHQRVTFIQHDSTDPELVADLATAIEYPLLVSLDSDHSEEHVYQELSLYAPLCQVGDWCVVEDTNISWGEERGARGGVERYLFAHPNEFRQDVLSERLLLSMNPGGWLQRMNACAHVESVR